MDSNSPNETRYSDRKKAALQMLKHYLDIYKKYSFGSVINLGDSKTYENALNDCFLWFIPIWNSVATYFNSLGIKGIVVNTDPLSISLEADPSAYSSLGRVLYHEVTHRIEDIHGDIQEIKKEEGKTEKLYAERNTEYMEYVASTALYNLAKAEEMVDQNPNTTPEQLRVKWDGFIKDMNIAKNELDETKVFPPNLALMKDWFGFEVDTDKILQHYASGAKGEAFKAMAEQILSEKKKEQEESLAPVPSKEQETEKQVEPTTFMWGDFGIWGITADAEATLAPNGIVTVKLTNVKNNYDEAWWYYDLLTKINSVERLSDGRVKVMASTDISGISNKVSWYKWEDRKWGPTNDTISKEKKDFIFYFSNAGDLKDFKVTEPTTVHYTGPKYEKPTPPNISK